MKLEGNASSHHFRDAVYVGIVVMAMELKVNERRARALCEQGRIEGAILVNGGWLAPLPLLRKPPCSDTTSATADTTSPPTESQATSPSSSAPASETPRD